MGRCGCITRRCPCRKSTITGESLAKTYKRARLLSILCGVLCIVAGVIATIAEVPCGSDVLACDRVQCDGCPALMGWPLFLAGIFAFLLTIQPKKDDDTVVKEAFISRLAIKGGQIFVFIFVGFVCVAAAEAINAVMFYNTKTADMPSSFLDADGCTEATCIAPTCVWTEHPSSFDEDEAPTTHCVCWNSNPADLAYTYFHEQELLDGPCKPGSQNSEGHPSLSTLVPQELPWVWSAEDLSAVDGHLDSLRDKAGSQWTASVIVLIVAGISFLSSFKIMVARVYLYHGVEAMMTQKPPGDTYNTSDTGTDTKRGAGTTDNTEAEGDYYKGRGSTDMGDGGMQRASLASIESMEMETEGRHKKLAEQKKLKEAANTPAMAQADPESPVSQSGRNLLDGFDSPASRNGGAGDAINALGSPGASRFAAVPGASAGGVNLEQAGPVSRNGGAGDAINALGAPGASRFPAVPGASAGRVILEVTEDLSDAEEVEI